MSDQLLASRWKGQPHRLEVWYATITDGATGTGAWLHHELVAPSDGRAPFVHGWKSLFPVDGPPTSITPATGAEGTGTTWAPGSTSRSHAQRGKVNSGAPPSPHFRSPSPSPVSLDDTGSGP